MRFYGLALLAGAVVLSACSGGSNNKADTSSASTAASGAATPAAGASSGATVAAAPATGKTDTIKMVGDEKGYRFEPSALTIKPGDAVAFTVVSGGPHNVAFDPTTVPADSKDQLNANMQGQISELSSPMLMNPGETYVISFGNIKPGTYPFHCTPHLAMGMKGTITVQ
jgi:plastocyanin